VKTNVKAGTGQTNCQQQNAGVTIGASSPLTQTNNGC
jgi:hypothetical protein